MTNVQHCFRCDAVLFDGNFAAIEAGPVCLGSCNVVGMEVGPVPFCWTFSHAHQRFTTPSGCSISKDNLKRYGFAEALAGGRVRRKEQQEYDRIQKENPHTAIGPFPSMLNEAAACVGDSGVNIGVGSTASSPSLATEGVKYDADKIPMGLFPPEAMEQISEVLGYGARKYATHNWRNGMRWSRLYDALLRHLNAWNSGENTDPESGLPHLAHAGCCLVFLIASQKSELGIDDRWRRGEKK